MFHTPNTDLIAALRRLPDPALDEGRAAEHRRTLCLARQTARAARHDRLRQALRAWLRRQLAQPAPKAVSTARG